MGIEQNDVQDSAATCTYQSLNLLDIHKSGLISRANENSPADAPKPRDGSAAGFGSSARVKPNFAQRTDSGTNNQVMDFSPTVYPADKPSQPDKPAPVAKLKSNYETAVAEQVRSLDEEAKFSPYTADALRCDADKYPPTRNEKDGTTTYTIEQFGMSDRNLPNGQNTADPYKRLVTVTVPDQATSLKECKFEYQDRQKIDDKEFYALIDRAQRRQCERTAESDAEHMLPHSEDMTFYTHGIRTGAESADFQALALQLTHGHSVINVDWKSTPPSEEKLGLGDSYSNERKGAAQSYGRFEKALDDTISHIGAEHTDLIAFSHGAMFDTKYLQHRKDSRAPMLNEVILTHPDVPISALPQPDKDGKIEPANRLYSCVSKSTHVIGSAEDLALAGAAYNDCEPSKSDKWLEQLQEKNRQMAIHARIGNGAHICRSLVAGCGGTYVIETVPKNKQDALKHFINMHGISRLINESDRPLFAAHDAPEGR